MKEIGYKWDVPDDWKGALITQAEMSEDGRTVLVVIEETND